MKNTRVNNNVSCSCRRNARKRKRRQRIQRGGVSNDNSDCIQSVLHVFFDAVYDERNDLRNDY